MKSNCTECGISYSADMEACPWCGHVRLTDLVPEQAKEVRATGADVPSAPDAMSDSGLGAPADVVGEIDQSEPHHQESPQPSRPEPVVSEPSLTHEPPAAQVEKPVEPELGEGQPPLPDVEPEVAETPTLDVLTHQDRAEVRRTRVERREMTQLLSDAPPPSGPPPPPGAPRPPGASRPPDATPIPTAPRWKRWIATAGIAAALIVLGALVAEFYPLGNSDSATGSTASTPSTASSAPTTAPSETTQSTTPTESTEAGPATTVQPGVIDPIGSAIAIEDLDLRADGLGPLEFGITGEEAIGRLVASFGQADEDSGVVAGDRSLGMCATDQMRIYRWGGLTAVLRASNGVETFVGYRLSLAGAGGHSTAGIETLSGLALGDTVETLQQLYSGVSVQLTERDGAPAFELYGTTDNLLLWGKVTSTDADGTVETIQSPLECSS